MADYLYLLETAVERQAIETAWTSVSSGGHSSSYWCQQRQLAAIFGRGRDKLVTLARERGFRKLLSALVTDLHKAQAEVVEIIAMAAADEPRERLRAD